MQTTLASLDTIQHADCVENCPIEGYKDTMLYGTYQLDDGVRNGHCGILQVSEDGDLKLQDKCHPGTGIFDMKWSHQVVKKLPVLGMALASGEIRLYQLENSQLSELCRSSPADDSMCLSLDWNNRVATPSNEPEIIVSESNGQVAHWTLKQDQLICNRKWAAHNLGKMPIEVWIAAFNYHETNTVYTGGDDGTWKGWDLRSTRPSFTSHAHAAGVCSIQSNPHQAHSLLTGSYDSMIHLWDTRRIDEPIQSFETHGGVWRLKWHPTEPTKFVAACMRAGFQVFDVRDDGLERTCHYTKHESLAYGVDWSYANPQRIGSCSFYDHLMHLFEL